MKKSKTGKVIMTLVGGGCASIMVLFTICFFLLIGGCKRLVTVTTMSGDEELNSERTEAQTKQFLKLAGEGDVDGALEKTPRKAHIFLSAFNAEKVAKTIAKDGVEKIEIIDTKCHRDTMTEHDKHGNTKEKQLPLVCENSWTIETTSGYRRSGLFAYWVDPSQMFEGFWKPGFEPPIYLYRIVLGRPVE